MSALNISSFGESQMFEVCLIKVYIDGIQKLETCKVPDKHSRLFGLKQFVMFLFSIIKKLKYPVR